LTIRTISQTKNAAKATARTGKRRIMEMRNVSVGDEVSVSSPIRNHTFPDRQFRFFPALASIPHEYYVPQATTLRRIVMPDTRYRIIGISADGSREVIVDGISQAVANTMATKMSSKGFEKVVIEPSGPIEAAQFNDRQSAVLFPPDVQPDE
jgi:hypothetical protein